MHLSSKKFIPPVVLVFIFMPAPQGYFGLTARNAIRLNDLLSSFNSDEYVHRQSNSKLCDTLHLQHQQKKICRRERGVAITLLQALRLASLECTFQFSMERWNCSLKQYRHNILRRGFKETSFMYAVSSAALVHAFASACSIGSIERCTCDESKHLENTKTWMWGGCGHNIRFGIKYTKKFTKKGRRSGVDIRAKVDAHNARVGIKVVKDNLKTVCKCHGVSGSCAMKSCWRQLAPFRLIGTILKRKYEYPLKVDDYTNHATRKISLSPHEKRTVITNRQLMAGKGELVFIDNSPSFCHSGKYSPGTSGRTCTKGKNCNVMCCGRGYNEKQTQIQRPCQCHVIWCCKVNCKKCLHEEKIYMCK